MPTSNHGAIVTPAGSAAVDPPTYLLAMGSSIEPGVVGYYADTTARDAGTLALRTAGKKGMRAFVLASPGPDWCGWDGTEWIWDHQTPTFHQPSAVGPSGGLSNTTSATWTTAAATITLSRRGRCWIGFDYDIQTLSPGGWGTVTCNVSVDASFITDGIAVLATEQTGDTGTGSRRVDRYQCRVPIMLAAGTHTLGLNVWKAGGLGSWQMNS